MVRQRAKMFRVEETEQEKHLPRLAKQKSLDAVSAHHFPKSIAITVFIFLCIEWTPSYLVS